MTAIHSEAQDNGQSIDIDARIDANPVGLLQYRIVAICFVLAVIDGFDAQAIAFVAPLLKTQFAIPAGEMGMLFASALVGLMTGAFLGSPLADRIGRKPVIIISCAVMGVFALLTASADSTFELFAFRFLTGVGLGGVMPNINTLTSEFAPARKRAFLMTAMFVGFPFGAVAGGLVSSAIIEAYGWPGVFILGGVAPLAMIAVVIPFLPESIRFLSAKGKRPQEIAAALSQIDRTYTYQEDDTFAVPKSASTGSIAGLFSDGRALGTLLIWVIVFANLLVMYSLMNWLPSVMREAGLPLDRAILAAVTFNLGGIVGGLLIAWAMDKYRPYEILSAAYAVAAIAIAFIGISSASLASAFTAIFIGGFTVMGSQLGMNALIVNFYPTTMRSTGLGWALAVGRIGSILGPIIVGAILMLQWPLSQVFLLLAAPALVSLVAIILLKTYHRNAGR